MRIWAVVEQTTRFVERVATLLLELTFATAVVLSGLFVGQQLNAWRDWYWGAYLHPAQTPAPEVKVTTEP